MASDLLSSIAGLFLKEREKAWADYVSNAADVQSEQLFDLLHEAEGTWIGKTYDFKSIVSYQDFRNRLPVTQAEDMKSLLVRIEQGEVNVLWPGSPKQILSSFQDARVPVSGQRS
jgi:hypothetical protein